MLSMRRVWNRRALLDLANHAQTLRSGREREVGPGDIVAAAGLVEPLPVVDLDEQPVAAVRYIRDVDALSGEHERVEVRPAPREAHPDRGVARAAPAAVTRIHRVLRGVVGLPDPVVVTEADLRGGPPLGAGNRFSVLPHRQQGI